MIIHIPNYDKKYRIASLALDEPTRDQLLSLNLFCIFIQNNCALFLPEGISFRLNKAGIDMFLACNNYDVFEFRENGIAFRYYDDSSVENIIFITGRCNSNCVMCPSPEYDRSHSVLNSPEKLISLIHHIPSDAKHLTITGGEPFMLGKKLFSVLNYCRHHLYSTDFLMLTNGRILCLEDYCNLLKEYSPPNLILGIPVHASDPGLHDTITQAHGSFRQTITGIKNLIHAGRQVELRIVVSQLNYLDLANLANFITTELQGIEYVSIMALEMTGNAHINKDSVWISYSKVAPYVKHATEILIEGGIDVRLYNFPLCTIPCSLWSIARKSISKDKIRFKDTCDNCSERDLCGGVFAGTYKLLEKELNAIHEIQLF